MRGGPGATPAWFFRYVYPREAAKPLKRVIPLTLNFWPRPYFESAASRVQAQAFEARSGHASSTSTLKRRPSKALVAHYWSPMADYWALMGRDWALIAHYWAFMAHYCALMAYYCYACTFRLIWRASSEKRDASTHQRRARAQTLDWKSRAEARGAL